ncbi:MAG: DinB family protein [Paenibacillus sp.]|uniref:DinB family protein n=1 Tax=Paenibacillus sp. TaxID=58172 RepID=UPI0025FF217A|nr:DinB family protein [Paenibacillus sp.]MBR2566312.1 DinB family protein [Paenibacillus sp.]
MNEKPGKDEYASFYEGYIKLTPEGNVIELLEQQGQQVHKAIRSLTEEQANYRYAEGKWSIKEVFGHLIDNERIMSTRLLRIARGDTTPLPGYDQDTFMESRPFDLYTVDHLAEEYAAVRRSTVVMLRQISPEAWLRRGIANNYTASTRSIAWVITGHELHHLSILRDRYEVSV